MAADFDKQSYWHHRFTTETSFEWLVPSQTFLSLIQPHISHHPSSSSSSFFKILHLGSGTSDLHNHFRAAGFSNVTNLDYEPLSISRGRHLEKQAFEDVVMKYVVGDVTKLQEEQSEWARDGFDLVVDKSTVDAVSCGGDDMVRGMVEGVMHCLKEGGIWISLSFSATRFEILDDGLEVSVEVIGKIPTPKLKDTDPDIFHWCYLLRQR